MDDPWGNAWSEADKNPVQEVTIKPKTETWITSPVSGDIGVAWTSEWQVPSDKQTSLKPSQGIFPSTSAPWESVLGTMGDSISPVDAAKPATPHAEESQNDIREDEPTNPFGAPLSFEEAPPAPEIPAIDEPVTDDLPKHEESTTTVAFDNEPAADDSWKALSHAAIVVGDEAAWDSAWKPPAEELQVRAESPQAPVVDEWTMAIEEKAIRDTRVPHEVMEMILKRFDELSEKLWPGEDLESVREKPAPRDEWQGGLENVEGLTPMINRYLPPPPTAPPVRFASTQIATSFQNAMKLTRSYGIVQNSPLSKLMKSSDTWEQSARKNQRFSLESWISKGSTSPLPPSVTHVGTSDSQQGKPSGIMGLFSRPSLDRGRQSSSSSPVPRTSLDSIVQMTTTNSSASISTTITPLGSSSGVDSFTAAPAPTSTPSAVTRFLSRWSRRTDDGPKPPTPVNLRSEELDFLDMMPEMKQGSAAADAIRKELGGAAAYPGAGSMTFGGMMPAASTIASQTSSSKRRSMPATTNLSQLSSADFDSLLEQQILEVEDEKIKESLIAASLISEPTPNAYTGISLFGKKAPVAGAQPLNQQPSSQMSNALFDDDEFDAFLAAPAKPTQNRLIKPTRPTQPIQSVQAFESSALPGAPTSYPQAPLPPLPRDLPYNTPSLPYRTSAKVSPVPPRTVAIMTQPGSRPSTPSTLSPAPLLPPPPGRTTTSTNLLNGSIPISPPAQRNGTAAAIAQPPSTSGIADLGSLVDFGSAPAPSPMANVPKPFIATKPLTSTTSPPNTGGLSAQDLSFFEGL